MFENEIVDDAAVGFAADLAAVGFAADLAAVGFAADFAADVAAGLGVDSAGHTFVLAPVPFVAASHVGDHPAGPAGPDSAAGAGALAAVDLFVSSHGAGTDSAGRAGIAGSVVLAVVGSLLVAMFRGAGSPFLDAVFASRRGVTCNLLTI